MINIKDIIKNLLKENLDNTLDNITEHLQQADKIYFNTGKLSPKIREQILKITNGDSFTKIISDMCFFILENNYNLPHEKKELSDNFLNKIENAYQELKTYNKNVFPIEGIDTAKYPLQIMDMLNIRRKIIDNIKKLPTIAVRNLKNEIRELRNRNQLYKYNQDLEYFLAQYSLLSNRDEKLRKKIEDKMFKSNTTATT
jgi:hypothetical protein